MFEHLRYKDAEVIANSETGKWTVERLDLNDPKFVAYRRDVIEIISLINNKHRDARKTLVEIKRLLTIETEESRKADLEKEMNSAEVRVSKLETMLKRVSG